jgi:hypothetical protein
MIVVYNMPKISQPLATHGTQLVWIVKGSQVAQRSSTIVGFATALAGILIQIVVRMQAPSLVAVMNLETLCLHQTPARTVQVMI